MRQKRQQSPDDGVGGHARTQEIMAWAIKSHTLNQLSHPGAPPQALLPPAFEAHIALTHKQLFLL